MLDMIDFYVAAPGDDFMGTFVLAGIALMTLFFAYALVDDLWASKRDAPGVSVRARSSGSGAVRGVIELRAAHPRRETLVGSRSAVATEEPERRSA